MVRNPRMLMVCGLLVAATGLAIGSRPIAASGDDALGAALLSAIVPGFGLLASREDIDSLGYARTLPPPSVSSATDTPPLDLSGREPRGPRGPRDERVERGR